MAEDKSPAELKKEEGNKFFAAIKYKEAIACYSDAIALDSTNAVLYCNRAFAQLKCENFGLAVEDATKSIELNPKHIKAYFHRGTAQYILGHLEKALSDFTIVYKMMPNNAEAKTKYDTCSSALRAARFAAAISSEETKLASEMDLTKQIIPNDYDGPIYESPMTVPFVESVLEHFRIQKRLAKKVCYQMVIDAIKLIRTEPNLVDIRISEPGQTLTVCGDTHGQYYDVLNIFKLNGPPSPTNMYLFNGDFVDRGSFSTEVMLSFICYKLLYPKHFFLSRGNHESVNMNRQYGFEGEVNAKYGREAAYPLFKELFQSLPLAHVINKKVYVVHGGLFAQDGVKLEDIQKIYRFTEPPEGGLMSDMLWSDPQKPNGRGPSNRGVGMSFGPDVTHRFLDDNGLDMIIRSHEAKAEGYEIEAEGRLVTVFSAPNYCDHAGNLGAYIKFAEDMRPEYFKFECVPHPDVPPMAFVSPYAM